MPTFIDLFAGCGGFSAGLRAAGFTSLGEVEVDAWACETLRHNFSSSRVIEADIRTISDDVIRTFAGVDVIVGGPPCQGFSVAGGTQFGVDDPRNQLFYWFLHWVELLRPRAAIIENVPNILSRTDAGSTVGEAVKSRLEPLGYRTTPKVLNAADFGVPQQRRRAFIVGVLAKHDFEFPEPTHAAEASRQGDLYCSKRTYTTVGEALSDLPDIGAGEGTDAAVPYATPPQSEYQKERRSDSGAVHNHIAMRHTGRLIERFMVIGPGQSLKDVPKEHGQIAKLTGAKVDKPFKYNNYRLDPERTSLAIPASFQSLFLHPRRHRNLTAREAARLMGFDDAFVFKGNRTTMSWEKNLSQYNQIGNAVCPPVAKALGKELVRFLERTKRQPRSSVTSLPRHDRIMLQRVAHVPKLEGGLPAKLLKELSSLAESWGQTQQYRVQGFEVPAAALPLAVILAEAERCPLCSPDVAPHARHGGQFCFLISKEDTSSLLENGQDHGLDYHLRVALSIEHQVGHFVGERLAELGVAELVNIQNVRTGRTVRGVRVRKQGTIDPGLSRKVVKALRAACLVGFVRSVSAELPP